jgi:hypothetical protein
MTACNSAQSSQTETQTVKAFETFSVGKQLSFSKPPSLHVQTTQQNSAVAQAIAQRPLIQHTFSNGMQVIFENKDGFAVREGDILVMSSQKMAETILNYEDFISHENTAIGTQAAGRTWTCYFWFIWCWDAVDSRWSNRTVYFEIGTDFSAQQATTLRTWISNFNAVSSVDWFENPSAGDRVRFENSGGCSSAVGRARGVQSLRLGNGCFGQSIVHHEMGHAVGLEHEQTRCDRDNYVRVNYENIVAGKEFNFNKYCDSQHRDLGNYDFDSLMHYAPYDFSKNNLPTISGLTPPNSLNYTGSPTNFGFAFVLSPGDLAGINSLYQ